MRAEPRIDLPREQIAAYCKKWGIREFAIFGSVVRDDFGPDIDILVEFEPGCGLALENMSEVIDEARSLLGRDADLVKQSIIRKPFRRKSILSSYEVVYAV